MPEAHSVYWPVQHSSPPLSVVVPTTHPWPACEAAVDILLPQCRALGAELVVAISSPDGLPRPLPDSLQDIRTVEAPGGSVFDLRAKGTEAASGDIIAWTEDHCRPAPDFCRRILESHRQHPEAALIGGAMINGSTSSMMDWSNFLCTFGPFVPPLNNHRIPRVPVAANLSVKRSALPAGPFGPGWIELMVEVRLWREGQVRFDDRIVVAHVQTWGLAGTPRAHFHNGRSTTGLIAGHMGPGRRLMRMLACLVLPAEILRTAVPPLLGKPGIPVLRCLPFMTLLAIAHSTGEFLGLISGSAGGSPLSLE